jgi:hypothetical protein
MELPLLSCKLRLPDAELPASRDILYSLSQVTLRLAILPVLLSMPLNVAPVVSNVQAAVAICALQKNAAG